MGTSVGGHCWFSDYANYEEYGLHEPLTFWG